MAVNKGNIKEIKKRKDNCYLARQQTKIYELLIFLSRFLAFSEMLTFLLKAEINVFAR